MNTKAFHFYRTRASHPRVTWVVGPVWTGGEIFFYDPDSLPSRDHIHDILWSRSSMYVSLMPLSGSTECLYFTTRTLRHPHHLVFQFKFLQCRGRGNMKKGLAHLQQAYKVTFIQSSVTGVKVFTLSCEDFWLQAFSNHGESGAWFPHVCF